MSYYPSTWNAWSSAMDSRSLWKRQGRQEEELFNVVVVVVVVVVVSAIHDHICFTMLHFLVSCHCSWVVEHPNICLPVMITKKVYFLLRTPAKKRPNFLKICRQQPRWVGVLELVRWLFPARWSISSSGMVSTEAWNVWISVGTWTPWLCEDCVSRYQIDVV